MKKASCVVVVLVLVMFVGICFAGNPNYIKKIRRDKKDGDKEVVLKSGYVLELDKKGKIEVEDNKGTDLGDKAFLIIKPNGRCDIAVRLKGRVEINGKYKASSGLIYEVFLSNVFPHWDDDGDLEVWLNDKYRLEIDKGEKGEPKGSMEIEDHFGNDLK